MGLQVTRRRSGTGRPSVAEDGRVRRNLPEPAFEIPGSSRAWETEVDIVNWETEVDIVNWETERDIVNCASEPGKLGSLSVSSYFPFSMMTIHYVPLGPFRAPCPPGSICG